MSASVFEQHRPASVDLRCATCGYGVAGARPPGRCPMCTGTRWQLQQLQHVAAALRLERPLGLRGDRGG